MLPSSYAQTGQKMKKKKFEVFVFLNVSLTQDPFDLALGIISCLFIIVVTYSPSLKLCFVFGVFFFGVQSAFVIMLHICKQQRWWRGWFGCASMHLQLILLEVILLCLLSICHEFWTNWRLVIDKWYFQFLENMKIWIWMKIFDVEFPESDNDLKALANLILKQVKKH